MLVIGLTGSIGTGKSEAASYMAQLGATVINADQVGHEAYTPHSEGWNRVVEAFGEGILGADGEIDRRALGAIVFSQPEQLAKLNKIMHPLIARMVADKIEGLRSRKAEVVVVEAALLFEAGWESLVQEIWSTDSPEEAVIKRLSERNGWGAEEVRKRISSQMDRNDRLERSDLIIDNSGDIAGMHRAIDELWERRVTAKC